MENINWIEWVQQYVVIAYLLTFILLSYGFKNLIAAIVSGVAPKVKYPKKAGVFIIGLIAGIIWFYAFEEDRAKLILTYALGTSMYDHIIEYIVGKFKKSDVNNGG